MAPPLPMLSKPQVAAYLDRLALRVDDVSVLDRAELDRLTLAHLVHVPFENLDLVFAGGVEHDLDRAVAKVLDGRGGWCFELNGAYGRLLVTLGLDVRLLGCAVLLDGPSDVIEHLALEVSGGTANLPPLLVDVGFGDSFVFPLDLNRSGPQPGGNGEYELIPSPRGTTVARVVDGVPEPTLRFKRVALEFGDFAPAAHTLQTDRSRSWSRRPFATRLSAVDERLTLRHDAQTRTTSGVAAATPVTTRAAWDDTLLDWFSMQRPGPWPNADGDVPAS